MGIARLKGHEKKAFTMPMQVVTISMLDDNYSYVLIDVSTGCAALVDPAQPDKALEVVKALGVSVTTILTTHKHSDHAGGNQKIARSLPGIEVVGGTIDKVLACTKPVNHDDVIDVG